MHWSLIQRLWPGSIAAANPAGSRLNHTNKYVPVHASMYSFTDSRTAMYLHVPPYTVPCTVMYHLVPPCTTLYHDSTGQYIQEHPGTYRPRNFLCQYILVPTKMKFLVPPCRQKRTYRDVPVQTALYHRISGVQDSRCPCRVALNDYSVARIMITRRNDDHSESSKLASSGAVTCYSSYFLCIFSKVQIMANDSVWCVLYCYCFPCSSYLLSLNIIFPICCHYFCIRV